MDKFPKEFKQILEGTHPWDSDNFTIVKAEKMPENKTELMSYLENTKNHSELNLWKKAFDIWSQGTLQDSLNRIKAKINEIDP